MKQAEIDKILQDHEKWLNCEPDGKKADLTGADLRWADLTGANLREADLTGADLREADLREADLTGADLREADLRWANLTGADLREADIDYSCWPLWCGGLDVHMDDRQAIQLLYHLMRNVLYSKNTSDKLKKALGTKKLITLANKMHRADVDRIKLPNEEPVNE